MSASLCGQCLETAAHPCLCREGGIRGGGERREEGRRRKEEEGKEERKEGGGEEGVNTQPLSIAPILQSMSSHTVEPSTCVDDQRNVWVLCSQSLLKMGIQTLNCVYVEFRISLGSFITIVV